MGNQNKNTANKKNQLMSQFQNIHEWNNQLSEVILFFTDMNAGPMTSSFESGASYTSVLRRMSYPRRITGREGINFHAYA